MLPVPDFRVEAVEQLDLLAEGELAPGAAIFPSAGPTTDLRAALAHLAVRAGVLPGGGLSGIRLHATTSRDS